MYIARAPSIGSYEGASFKFPKLPELKGQVHRRYVEAYPDGPFQDAQGAIGATNEQMFNKFTGQRVIQRAWHDAESAVLTLLLFLLRCSPIDSKGEPKEKLQHMQDIYKSIRNTSMGL